jgi:hypothetical protein
MSQNPFDKLVACLNELEQAGIHYQLMHARDGVIMVTGAVPGERWEIEFLTDGSVEVERFVSEGEIRGEEAIEELFALYSEPESGGAEAAV